MSLKRVSISRSLSRTAALCFSIITFLSITFYFHDGRTRFGIYNASERPRSQIPLLSTTSKASAERPDLSEQECRTAFPGATQYVDDAVSRGKFVFEKDDGDYQGLVQAQIRDGRLFVLTTAPDRTPEILIQRTAILSQIHRALLTSPTPLPNTRFAFVINDSPKNNSWAFARPNKASKSNNWPMPHFGFWAWPPHVGSVDDALARISNIEREIGWEKKKDQAVWRGTPWFNPLANPHLRQDLIKSGKGKEWADIQALGGSVNGTRANGLGIEEFCAYKYVVYTEGVTYSGRLPYHQACESVLLMAPLTWLTSTTSLIRPVVAEDLINLVRGKEKQNQPAFNGPPDKEISKQRLEWLSSIRPLLQPLAAEDWRKANAIYVKSDFSNLEQTVLFLREHGDIAQRIARNQRELLVGRGYLGNAAEACYWRALIRGWASAAIADDGTWGTELGESFESWRLKEVVQRKEHGR